MQMVLDSLRPPVATRERISTPPNSVAAVRDAAAVGARADRGHDGATADRGLRLRQPERGDEPDADTRPDDSARVAVDLDADLDAVPDGPTPTGDEAPASDDAPLSARQAAAGTAAAVLEPESTALMAARRAYAAGIMLVQTRAQAMPAGAVLDGTV